MKKSGKASLPLLGIKPGKLRGNPKCVLLHFIEGMLKTVLRIKQLTWPSIQALAHRRHQLLYESLMWTQVFFLSFLNIRIGVH